jgi:hypothetical protein
MKIINTRTGSKLKITRKEWEEIGRLAGFSCEPACQETLIVSELPKDEIKPMKGERKFDKEDPKPSRKARLNEIKKEEDKEEIAEGIGEIGMGDETWKQQIKDKNK